jgi:putative tricarboxylic transport membrane protein
MSVSVIKAECIAAGALMAAGAAAFAISFSFVVDGIQATEFGPDLYPKGTAIALFVASALWFISSLRKLRHPSESSEDDPEGTTKAILLYDAAAFLTCCAYVTAIGWLGYYVSTFLFLTLATWALGARHWFTILTVAGGYTVASYLLFTELLMIRLPTGIFV